MKFDGKIVLVTGSSRGIGAAIAKAFASEGATVVINYLKNSDAAFETSEKCEKLGGTAKIVQADITSAEQIKVLIEEILHDYAKIDVLVKNALNP